MARLLRHERKARTRSQLLDTAKRVFLRGGYHATTLEEIAEMAGFSKGAVYSNFASKDDLFLELLDELVKERLEQLAQDLAASRRTQDPLAELARRMARRFFERGREWTLLITEFWVHAARDPRLSRAFAERHERLVRAAAALVAENLAETAELPSTEAVDLTRVTSALVRGLTLEQLLDPTGTEPELLASTLELVWRDAVARGAARAGVRHAGGPAAVLREPRR